MEFFDVIRARRSIRDYRPDPVPEESIARIREAVTLAPTAVDFQPFRVFLIRDRELLRKAAEVYPRAWLKTAPVIAVVAGCDEEAWTRLEGDKITSVDCAIVMEHIVLAAAAEGLGSCWICAFERAQMDRALDLPPGWHSFAMTPIGYPASGPAPLKRKDENETFTVI